MASQFNSFIQQGSQIQSVETEDFQLPVVDQSYNLENLNVNVNRQPFPPLFPRLSEQLMEIQEPIPNLESEPQPVIPINQVVLNPNPNTFYDSNIGIIQYPEQIFEPQIYPQQLPQDQQDLLDYVINLRNDVDKLKHKMEEEENDIEPTIIKPKLPNDGVINIISTKQVKKRRKRRTKKQRKTEQKETKVTKTPEEETEKVIEIKDEDRKFIIPKIKAFSILDTSFNVVRGCTNFSYLSKDYSFSKLKCINIDKTKLDKIVNALNDNIILQDDLLSKHNITIPKDNCKIYQLLGDKIINPSNSRRYFSTLFMFMIALKGILKGTGREINTKIIMSFGIAIHSKQQNETHLTHITDFFNIIPKVQKQPENQIEKQIKINKINIEIDDVHLQTNSFIGHLAGYNIFVYFRVLFIDNQTFILTNIEAAHIDLLKAIQQIPPLIIENTYWENEYDKVIEEKEIKGIITSKQRRDINWALSYDKLPDFNTIFEKGVDIQPKEIEIGSSDIMKGKRTIDKRIDYKTFDIGIEFLLPYKICNYIIDTTISNEQQESTLDIFSSFEMTHIEAIISTIVHTIWNIDYFESEIVPITKYKSNDVTLDGNQGTTTPNVTVTMNTEPIIIDDLQMPDIPKEYKGDIDEEINITKE